MAIQNLRLQIEKAESTYIRKHNSCFYASTHQFSLNFYSLPKMSLPFMNAYSNSKDETRAARAALVPVVDEMEMNENFQQSLATFILEKMCFLQWLQRPDSNTLSCALREEDFALSIWFGHYKQFSRSLWYVFDLIITKEFFHLSATYKKIFHGI